MKDTMGRQTMDRAKSPLRKYSEILPWFEFRGVTILRNNPMNMGFKFKKGRILLPFEETLLRPDAYRTE